MIGSYGFMDASRRTVMTRSRAWASSRHTRPWGSTIACGLLGICLHAFLPATARAETSEPSAADTAAARALAVEGLKLAQAGRCDEAADRLERAEKLHHAPIVLARLGECRVEQGRLVEGTEMLRKVLREPLPAHPAPSLSKAYERAQTVLDATAPRIARLTISVGLPKDVEAVVTVDAEAVPAALLGEERPTDPGEHVVEAA